MKQYESYYDIKYVEKKDERGDIYRTLIRMEQENYLVFQFDISSQNGSMSLEFSEELCKGKVGKSDYFIPTVSTESLLRIDEIANYPNKLQHIRYIRQHLSSINDNLADKYLPSNYKSILNRIIEEQVGGGENGIIDEFINKLLELEFLLNDYLIPKDAICIVGSSVLTIRGIRSNHDIDIVMLSHYRKRFGLELYKLNDTIEIVTSGWARSKHRKTIPDDILINDNRFHTMWNGFKFANIDMLRERKEYQGRPKDVEDLKLIDEYIKDNK